MGGFTDLLSLDGGARLPPGRRRGRAAGRVSEFFSLTQLSSAWLVSVTVTGLDVTDADGSR